MSSVKSAFNNANVPACRNCTYYYKCRCYDLKNKYFGKLRLPFKTCDSYKPESK